MGKGEQQPLLRETSGGVRFDEDSLRETSSSRPLSTDTDRRSFLHSSSSLSQVMHKLTKSERAEALQKQGVGGAAFLIRDAVLGDTNPTAGCYDPYANPAAELRNLIAIVCRRLASYRPISWFMHAALWMLVILTFIEPPIWCQSWDETADDSCPNLLSLQGIAAGQDETSDPVQYYPNSKSMLLTTYQSHVTEWVCLAVVGTFLLIRFGRDGMSFEHFFRQGRLRNLRFAQIGCFFLLILGLVIKYRVYQPYLRGFLLASYQPTVIRDVRVLIQMLPEVSNVLALLAVFITFYAWFGCVMFVDTEEGDLHFPNLIEAWWTLWICVTTANYPDVMMPSYNENRWTALYFVSFMILSFFFLMNVILSSVVNEYDTAVEARQEYRGKMARENLEKAYRLLDPNETGKVDRDTIMAIFFILNEDFPEVRRISDEETKLLFAILDKDGSSNISEEEFLDFGNLLLLEFVRSDAYASVIQTHFPKIYESVWYKRIEEVVKSDEFEFWIDCILGVNAIVIAIQSFPELSSTDVHLDSRYWDGSIDTIWELVEAIFTVVYAIEAAIKIIVLSWRKYSESPRNIFDFVITILAVVSSIIVYYPNNVSDSRIIRMVVMARVLRLVRLLTAIKRFQLLGRITAEILPDAVPVIAILFIIMYFFAAVGVQLYGGLITRDPSNRLSWLLLGTDFADNEYWANNFNDMISAMNVLFNLLVINNWTGNICRAFDRLLVQRMTHFLYLVHRLLSAMIFSLMCGTHLLVAATRLMKTNLTCEMKECEIGFEATTEEKWCRLFFIAFHVIGVILVNNLVTAFVINSFMTQLGVMREKDFKESVGDGEATIYHGEAEFDGSVITGTKTCLTGKYVARIRHAPESEEGHYNERLKRLFSRTSSNGDDKAKK